MDLVHHVPDRREVWIYAPDREQVVIKIKEIKAWTKTSLRWSKDTHDRACKQWTLLVHDIHGTCKTDARANEMLRHLSEVGFEVRVTGPEGLPPCVDLQGDEPDVL